MAGRPCQCSSGSPSAEGPAGRAGGPVRHRVQIGRRTVFSDARRDPELVNRLSATAWNRRALVAYGFWRGRQMTARDQGWSTGRNARRHPARRARYPLSHTGCHLHLPVPQGPRLCQVAWCVAGGLRTWPNRGSSPLPCGYTGSGSRGGASPGGTRQRWSGASRPG